MWMHAPGKGILNKQLEANNYRLSEEIVYFTQLGWKEMKPMWIKHPDTGVTLYVTHPEHQRRLIKEEGGVEVEAPKDAPKELIAAK